MSALAEHYTSYQWTIAMIHQISTGRTKMILKRLKSLQTRPPEPGGHSLLINFLGAFQKKKLHGDQMVLLSKGPDWLQQDDISTHMSWVHRESLEEAHSLKARVFNSEAECNGFLRVCSNAFSGSIKRLNVRYRSFDPACSYTLV